MSNAIYKSALNAEERVTKAVPTIITDHALIHEGIAFTTAGIVTVANNKVGAIFIKVPGDLATVTCGMTAALSDLTYTAVDVGTTGNLITVTHVDPEGVTATLGVTVVDRDITVSLGRAASAINTTAAQVKALINSNAAASALVTCEDEGVGSGLVNALAVQTLTGGADRTYCHFTAATVQSNAAITVSLMEQYVKAPGDIPSALTPANRNRISSNISAITITAGADVTPTSTTGATTLATTGIGANQDSKKIGGASNSAHEWVLKPGYNYCIAFSNASGATATISYDLFWYEEDNA